MISKKPIGVFDSGIGGLTVLRQLQRALPQEDFVYFADSENLPYGDKSPEQIIDYARKTISWLQNDIDAKLVVAACHTSSAIALDLLAPEFSIPIIGTIHPMVETVLQNHQNRKIGIIATPTSVDSLMHEKTLRKAGFKGEIHSIPCPNFVPIIESGRLSGPELLRSTSEYLRIFETEHLNTLIYGCTHYPWISEVIQDTLPKGVDLIDPADNIAAKVSQELYKHKMLNTSWNKVKAQFYCSGSTDRFSKQINLLLSITEPVVTLIKLNDLGLEPEKLAVNQ